MKSTVSCAHHVLSPAPAGWPVSSSRIITLASPASASASACAPDDGSCMHGWMSGDRSIDITVSDWMDVIGHEHSFVSPRWIASSGSIDLASTPGRRKTAGIS